MSDEEKKRKPNLPEEFMKDGMAPHANRGSIYDYLSEEQIALMQTMTPKQKEMLKAKLLGAANQQHNALKLLANKLFRTSEEPSGAVSTRRKKNDEISVDEIREFAEISGKLVDGLTKTSKVLLQLKEPVNETEREAEQEVDFLKYLESNVIKSKKTMKKKDPVDSLLEKTASIHLSNKKEN